MDRSMPRLLVRAVGGGADHGIQAGGGLRRTPVRFGFGRGRRHLRLSISPLLSHRYFAAGIATLSRTLDGLAPD